MAAIGVRQPGGIASRRARGPALAAWAGVAFVPLFLAGFLMEFIGRPDPQTGTDAAFRTYYADRGHRVVILVGAYLMIVASLAFLAFAAGLAARLRDAAEDSPVLSRLMSGAGVLVAGAIGVAAIAGSTLAGAIQFQGGRIPGPDTLRMGLDTLEFPMLGVVAALAAAVFIAAAATIARARGVFPSWLTMVSYVCAAALLVGFLFFPLVALPLWVLVTSITMLIRPMPAEIAPAAATMGTVATTPAQPVAPAAPAPRVEEAPPTRTASP